VRQTFRKAERLSSKKIINKLFEKGSAETKSVFAYPFRVVFMFDTNEHQPLPAIVVSVPKRSFKKAVDRNLLKRRIKEAYRIHKPILIQDDKPIAIPTSIAFLFVAKEILPYSIIEQKMKLMLSLLRKESVGRNN
jgi:ribonuclease P protein component